MDMQREAELTNVALCLIETQPADMKGVLSGAVDHHDEALLLVMASGILTFFPEYNITLAEAFDILEIILKAEHIEEEDFPAECTSIRECTSPLGACRCIPNEELNK